MKLTIGFSTRNLDESFIEHLNKTIGLKKTDYTIIPKVNNGEYSLSETYNQIISESNSDIICLIHDDIKLEKNWGIKLLKHFDKGTHDIIGLAGALTLPKSGKWWEDTTSMIGIVKHSNDGKTWVSKYSESQGYNIKDVTIIDGLFISFNKNNIKHQFDESFKGFHFYDLAFCYPNYLDGIKIGVVTDISVTHMSIGQTNEQWELNRIQFSEKYKETFKNLKILIGCLNFNGYTGSELYVFELAKGLREKGHDVSVVSNIGSPLKENALKYGIKLFKLDEPPGYKLGDGKWVAGNTLSTPNQLYRISEVNFDIVHCNHLPVGNHLLQLYPNSKFITSIHSEVHQLEHPVISPKIKKYIAIRPEIKDFLIEKFNISEDLIDIIYNPIDDKRFNTDYINIQKRPPFKKVKLFVGTIDYLRRKTIEDLVNTLDNFNEELVIVGKNTSNYIHDLIKGKNNISYYPDCQNIEDYVKKCDETAGVLLGRTTIEGWLCGKPGWIYDIDSEGNILSKKLHEVPNDIDKFKLSTVIEKIENLYKEILC